MGGRISIDGQLVDCEAKGRLEAEIPDELAKVVLSRLRVTLYLSDDGWVRSCAHSERDKQLSPLDVFELYGGTALEDVLEYGSEHVGWRR